MATFVIKAVEPAQNTDVMTMEITVPGFDDLCEDVKGKFLVGLTQFVSEFYGEPAVVVQQPRESP